MASNTPNMRASTNKFTQSEYDYLVSQSEAAEEKVMKLQEELLQQELLPLQQPQGLQESSQLP